MSATENTEFHGEGDSAGWRRLISEIQTLATELNSHCGTDSNRVGLPASADNLRRLGKEIGLAPTHPLLRMYVLADGLSLMDCFNGLAIHPVERVVAGASDGYVPRVIGDLSCVCFGSTGGGDLFCFRGNSSEVVRLTEIAVENGKANLESWQVRTVARDLSEFLFRVCDDLSACLQNREGHEYLSSP